MNSTFVRFIAFDGDILFDFSKFKPFTNYLEYNNIDFSDGNNPEVIEEFIIDEFELENCEIKPIVKKNEFEFEVRLYDTYEDSLLDMNDTNEFLIDGEFISSF